MDMNCLHKVSFLWEGLRIDETCLSLRNPYFVFKRIDETCLSLCNPYSVFSIIISVIDYQCMEALDNHTFRIILKNHTEKEGRE
nr:hypothetical protein Itr_chr15CG08530 [Ipomoea trifida]